MALEENTNINELELLYFWNYDDLIYHSEYRSECVYAFEYSGIEDISQTENLIYPNPTTGIITIDPDLDLLNIQIYDTKGSMIVKTKNKEINLSKYPDNIYFVVIHTKTNLPKKYKFIKKS
jgi:hypothetical protein